MYLICLSLNSETRDPLPQYDTKFITHRHDAQQRSYNYVCNTQT